MAELRRDSVESCESDSAVDDVSERDRSDPHASNVARRGRRIASDRRRMGDPSACEGGGGFGVMRSWTRHPTASPGTGSVEGTVGGSAEAPRTSGLWRVAVGPELRGGRA